jgi:ABC-type sugar transport system ATPase subunit
MQDYILEARNISKSFFSVKVLDNVSFTLKPGEVHAVVGKNGDVLLTTAETFRNSFAVKA